MALPILLVLIVYLSLDDDTPETNHPSLPTFEVEDVFSLPKPIHFPVPIVSKQLIGKTIRLNFTVNELGKPEKVHLDQTLAGIRNESLMHFASLLREDVENWEFEPAQDGSGNPVSVKVIMPVRVVKKSGQTLAQVSLILDEGSHRL